MKRTWRRARPGGDRCQDGISAPDAGAAREGDGDSLVSAGGRLEGVVRWVSEDAASRPALHRKDAEIV